MEGPKNWGSRDFKNWGAGIPRIRDSQKLGEQDLKNWGIRDPKDWGAQIPWTGGEASQGLGEQRSLRIRDSQGLGPEIPEIGGKRFQGFGEQRSQKSRSRDPQGSDIPKDCGAEIPRIGGQSPKNWGSRDPKDQRFPRIGGTGSQGFGLGLHPWMGQETWEEPRDGLWGHRMSPVSPSVTCATSCPLSPPGAAVGREEAEVPREVPGAHSRQEFRHPALV